MKEYTDLQGENFEEAEMGQLLAVQLNDEAVARVRAAIPKGPSLSHCSECGDEIPEQRQKLVPGCKFCIDCQTFKEKRRR